MGSGDANNIEDVEDIENVEGAEGLEACFDKSPKESLKEDSKDELLKPVAAFLGCATPQAWLDRAVDEKAILLVDHAHCEKKAASTALNLLFRYVDRTELLHKLAQLAREELLHFEQVLDIMEKRGVQYEHLQPSRYAQGLRQHVRTYEPAKLIDTLIIGAFIEARSCERFAALADVVDAELAKYYRFLLKSESRHFLDYLELARLYFDQHAGAHDGQVRSRDVRPDEFDERVAFFRREESRLILEPDELFRFHSGVPNGRF